MERAVIVKGRIIDERHIELDESVGEIRGPVEVTVRPLVEETEDILDFLARLPRGTRTKEGIDRQVREERDSWKSKK